MGRNFIRDVCSELEKYRRPGLPLTESRNHFCLGACTTSPTGVYIVSHRQKHEIDSKSWRQSGSASGRFRRSNRAPRSAYLTAFSPVWDKQQDRWIDQDGKVRLLRPLP